MEFYTVKEVAKILKIDVETVRRHIYRKKIKAYKIGSDWRIKSTDLEKYITEGSNFD